MQKVESSSLFIRSHEGPGNGAFSLLLDDRAWTARDTLAGLRPSHWPGATTGEMGVRSSRRFVHPLSPRTWSLKYSAVCAAFWSLLQFSYSQDQPGPQR